MPIDKTALLADIYLLSVLAQTGNFTRAAVRLRRSKGSVSMRISQLERLVGVPLVHRTTRTAGLTDAGRQLVGDCAPAFERIQAAFTAVNDLSGAPRGAVRITAPVALGRQHIAPSLAAFLRRYPEIHVQIELTDRLIDLAQEGIDLAIRHTDTAPENYVAWPLCATRALLVASRDYLRHRGTPQHPSELVKHDCLLYLRSPPDDTWTFVREEAEEKSETVSVRVQGPLQVNNSEVLRRAVLDGIGIGLLPDFSTLSQSRQGMSVILADWRLQGFFRSRVFALRPWAPNVPLAVRLFIAHLREQFAKGFLSPPLSRRSRDTTRTERQHAIPPP